MSFTLTDEDMALGPPNDGQSINDMIYGYFEEALHDEGANSLDEAYEVGMQRLPADEYLWNLDVEKLREGDYTFSNGDIIELRKQNPIIQAAAYPPYLKDAVAQLLTKLNEKSLIPNSIKNKRRNQLVREMYEGATKKSAAPGHGPANRIRNFLGVKVPRGAEGGSRKKSSKTKKNRKVKKTLRKRK